MITLVILLNIYFVSFTDKPLKGVPALSERAIEQREKWHIPTDESDYPVSHVYLDSLRGMGIKVHHTSRWFNGATCEMSEETSEQVKGLGFVMDVEMTRDNSAPIYGAQRRKFRVESDEAQSAGKEARAENVSYWTDKQLETYNLLPLHAAGYEGQGILMAVCDGGFYNAQTMRCFRPQQELGHFDFTDDEDDFYGSTGSHGSECLSVISGILGDEYGGFYGAATKATYYLMRSEENVPESPKEMDNLVAALEKADSLGVNVFSVSLGYALFDNSSWTLSASAMDGKTTRCSRAATIAARKGMLVCVAAGNEGNSEWRTISAPADADSILTVGAVGIDSIAGSFSSYGPSADGRVKPEVCAVGVQTTLCYPTGDMIVTSNGTSFATPLMAGMAAALWSALPNENAMQIRERIIRSAHLYDNPDSRNQMGYGIPDAWKAYTMSMGEGVPAANDESAEKPIKILRGSQIVIVRGGHIYTLSGMQVE